jgi:hypothetical protein
MEGWAIEIWEASIKHSWLNKHGDFGTCRTTSFQKLWKLTFIEEALFLKLNWVPGFRLLGEVSIAQVNY